MMAEELREISHNTLQPNNGNEAVDGEEFQHPLRLDLGDDPRLSENSRLENQGASSSAEQPRRDENPFSFKHFLRSDLNCSRNKGARPKVYCEGRSIVSISDLEIPSTNPKETRGIPEYSSALPDFVQDHLVIEQSYLCKPPNNNFNLDMNLPDFTPSRGSINVNRINLDTSQPHNHKKLAVPLDLPLRPSSDFPLDLPLAPPQQNGSINPANNEVNVSKSLPDFLTDGAVISQDSNGSIADSPENESQRLRRELEIVKAQLAEQIQYTENLSRELELTRNKEHDYTQTLAKALEQVEKNLERSNIRAATAENTVTKLKQEIQSLVSELNNLKSENLLFKGEEGASGGNIYYIPNELHSQRLAQELKTAASTAEHSLRQLLTGVDNLRIMAATLENMHRIGEKRGSFLDVDEDSGPAL